MAIAIRSYCQTGVLRSLSSRSLTPLTRSNRHLPSITSLPWRRTQAELLFLVPILTLPKFAYNRSAKKESTTRLLMRMPSRIYSKATPTINKHPQSSSMRLRTTTHALRKRISTPNVIFSTAAAWSQSRVTTNLAARITQWFVSV